eukprot:scaffold47449_cov110-Phaeocystis_antarctica.AAC.6
MRYHVRRLLARGDEPLVDGRILCTTIGERVTLAEAHGWWLGASVRKARLQGVVGARVEAKGKVDVTRNHLSLLTHPIRDAHVYRDDTHVPPAAVVSRGLHRRGRDRSGWLRHIPSRPQPCDLANNGQLQPLIPVNELTVVGAQRGTSGMPARRKFRALLKCAHIETPVFEKRGTHVKALRISCSSGAYVLEANISAACLDSHCSAEIVLRNKTSRS